MLLRKILTRPPETLTLSRKKPPGLASGQPLLLRRESHLNPSSLLLLVDPNKTRGPNSAKPRSKPPNSGNHAPAAQNSKNPRPDPARRHGGSAGEYLSGPRIRAGGEQIGWWGPRDLEQDAGVKVGVCGGWGQARDHPNRFAPDGEREEDDVESTLWKER